MQKVIAVIGPTASGKTAFAARLADALNAEVVSVDSRQVYKKLDIGSGKDLDSYIINERKIPYHLIDIAEPTQSFDLSDYLKAFDICLFELNSKNVNAILCGGSGLYLEAAVNGYIYPFIPTDASFKEKLNSLSTDNLLHKFNELPITAFTKIADISTRKRLIRAIEICEWLIQHPDAEISRPAYNVYYIGLNPDIETRKKRIGFRLRDRLLNGMLDEAKSLLSEIGVEKMERFGLEYKFLAAYLTGKMSYEEMESLLEIAIRQFSKRQMTYFRKMEKDGAKINWIKENEPTEEVISLCQEFLQT